MALCQRPRRQQFLQDIAHTATYVQMSSSTLSEFVRKIDTPYLELEPVIQKQRPFFKNWEIKTMFKHRAIAFSFVALIILFFCHICICSNNK
jgi:hypothetical protein